VRLVLLLVLGACTPQMAEDALAGSEKRCAEAQSLYDADRNLKAGALVVAVCAG
jgi:hypothetical protein